MNDFYNITVLLGISYFICLFPLRLSFNKNKLIFTLNKTFYCVRIFFFNTIIVICIVVNCYNILDEHISLKNIVFIFCSFPIILVILEIQIIGLLNQEKYHKVLVKFHSLHTSILSKSNGNKEQTDYLYLLHPLFIFCCFLYLFTLYFVYYSIAEAFIINFGFTLSKFMIFTNSCVIVNFLRLIKGDFRKLNNILTSSDDFIFVFRTYLELVFLCKKVNKLFGRQLLLSILTYLIWTIYEMYHLAILWSCKDCPRFLIMLASSYTIIQESILFTILWTCQNTRKESNRFKEIWYSKLSKKVDIFNQKTIEKYSLKLLNHNVLFTAMGLYVLDMQQFFAMLGSLVTLIVILTQFSTTV
ncbi:uncharacterized protein LOC135123861 [Zophobas morio]|uniref:uncharacterized protein LOC135123861 n=1 Tax=Zophobas morio TaxID=2755281 RepID=UPI0030837FF4